MKKFYLIDWSGFLYRAYYAFPEMPDKDWHNINTVYGFFRMLIKIFHDKPDYFLIARDAPTKTHRHEAYPEYKANRAKAPDDFKLQIPIVQDITKQLKIPSLVMPWYEADDIIASMVKKFQVEPDIVCNVFSADKDLKQLLCENVIFTDPSKWITYNTNDFIQEFWFEPQYILDYLSLIGDNADNIKWVPGIWPKWASTLIQKYNTIENIYEHLPEISWSTREKLISWREYAQNAKKLISLELVPQVDLFTLQDYELNIDFVNYQRVLIQNMNFVSMEKTLTELKNTYQKPQQNSLF